LTAAVADMHYATETVLSDAGLKKYVTAMHFEIYQESKKINKAQFILCIKIMRPALCWIHILNAQVS